MFEILACIIVYLSAKVIEWSIKLAWFMLKICWYLVTFPFQLLRLAINPAATIKKPSQKRNKPKEDDDDEYDIIDALIMYDCLFGDD